MSYASDYASQLQRLSALAKLQLGAGAQLRNRPASSKADLANLILQKARSDFSIGEGPKTAVSGESEKKDFLEAPKSVALNILDVLSRPLNTVAGAADEIINEGGGNPLKGAWEGLSGKDDTTFIDVLQKRSKNSIDNSADYQQILKEQGAEAATEFKRLKEQSIDTGRVEDVTPGLIADFALDPLNLVGGGLAKKLTSGFRGLSKPTAEFANSAPDLAAAAADDVSGALAGTPKPPISPVQGDIPEAFTRSPDELSPQALTDVNFAASLPNQVEFPKATRPPFRAPARPDEKVVLGVPVEAIKGKNLKSLMSTVNTEPKYANLDHVYNKDITPDQYAGLTKARVVEETAKIVDQAGKGNPVTLDFLKPTPAGSLTPVARQFVDNAVNRVMREIKASIPDPVKARAAGRQPRHPVYNAPTQNNLSNKLTNSARQQLQAESKTPIKTASPKLIPAVYRRYLDMLRNAEESMVSKGRELGDDSLFPRGGIKPDTPYLRLSDVLSRLPQELAQKAILGPKTSDKVLPSVLLRAVTGDKKALATLARDHREISDAIRQVDWAPLMTREYALRVIESSNKMDPALKESAQLIDEAQTAPISDTDRAFVTDSIKKEVKSQFKNEMPAVRGTFNELLNKMAKPQTANIVEDIINKRKSRLAAGVTGGVNGQKVAQDPRIAVATAHIAEALGVPVDQVRRNIGLLDPKAPLDIQQEFAERSADGIFSTVLSWVKPDYGYKELRPTVIKNISVRKASAATRSHQFNQILDSIPPKEYTTFWHEVQGIIPVVPAHAKAVQDLQRVMGNMFGESGLMDKFDGNSSVARSGVSIKDLNKHLRIAGVKDFQFVKEAPDPLTGKNIKFDGPLMLQTWRNYIPKSVDDLRQFVFGISQAVENAMVEYSAFANMAAIWASKTPKGGFVKVSDMHPAIDGLYFPQEIVSQIGKFSRGIDEFYEPLTNNKAIALYDQGLRTWKSGVTIYAPSHHIRNQIGDMYLAWLDGVSNPVYYKKAATVLKANYGHYSDIESGKLPLQNILGEGRETEIIREIMGQSNKRMPSGSKVISRVKIGNSTYQININQVYQMAFRHGLLPHSNVIEDLPGTETLMENLANRFHPGKKGLFQPFGGKVQTAARQISETREHYARLAHFLHALEHTKANSLEELFEVSAQRVRKYHPDGLDLTSTEKRVLRRLFPFYAWTRKAIPLILEGLVMNPAKVMAYPKLMSGIQELQGQESSVSDPWPDDQLFPNWLSSNVIGPTFDPNSALAKAIARSDEERGYAIVNPGNPATDILEDYGNNPIKGVGNSITPFLKIPAEIGFGTEFMSGAPIEDKTEYIDKNIPILSTLSRITSGGLGSGLVEGGDLKGKETEPFNLQALLNYLTGAGILDTGRYTKGGEFDLKERLRKEAKENG